ncbi:MAG: hypothetical protein QXE06_00725 [Candidatus Bathyarchaeia archaeon]
MKALCVKRRSLLSALLISAIIFASILSMTEFRVFAATSAYVSPDLIVLDPATNGTIGTLFNVTVWVTGVEDMKTWQVKMSFNHSMINITRWYEPTWDPDYVFYGKTTLPVPGPVNVRYEYVNETSGWIGVGSAIFPAPSPGNGFTGDGLLCILQFNVTASPPEGELYTTQLYINYPTDTFWIKAGESTKRAFDSYTPGTVTIIPEFIALIMLIGLVVSTVTVTLSRKHVRKVKTA